MGHRRQHLERLLAVHPDPLVRLVVADEIARELRVLERKLALEAHDAGHTWEDIGRSLGVSRAAAHERFSPGNTRAARRKRRPR